MLECFCISIKHSDDQHQRGPGRSAPGRSAPGGPRHGLGIPGERRLSRIGLPVRQYRLAYPGGRDAVTAAHVQIYLV